MKKAGRFFPSSFSSLAAPLLGPLTCGQKCLRSEVGQPRVGWANSPNISRLFYQLALKGYYEAVRLSFVSGNIFTTKKEHPVPHLTETGRFKQLYCMLGIPITFCNPESKSVKQ